MNFPKYVPESVQRHIRSYLEGDEWVPRGLEHSLLSAKERLIQIENQIAEVTPDDVESNQLRKKKTELTQHHDWLYENVECLKRLAFDERMEEVYESLRLVFDDDEKSVAFIHAAWAARVDFTAYRKKLKRAAELKNQIAGSSENLARLIRQFFALGMSNGPSEFHSIPSLLEQTDNAQDEYMWRVMCPLVLGETSKTEEADSREGETHMDQPPIPEIRITYVERDDEVGVGPEQEYRNLLHYAWGLAPDLSELLDTVAKAAHDYQPELTGFIGAGIRTRQKSKAGNKEYLRAFGHLLMDRGVEPTNMLKQIAADAANVVINDPDFTVTYDDVVKAFLDP